MGRGEHETETRTTTLLLQRKGDIMQANNNSPEDE